MSQPTDAARVHAWLKERRRLLIVTHQRPDGDALGSAFAARDALSQAGIHCQVFVDEAIPQAYAEFAPDDLLVDTSVDLDTFDGLLCLDSAKANRVALPSGVTIENCGLSVCNVDHHLDNPRYGEIALVDSSQAATCEVLTRFFEEFDWSISKDCAELLLIGIITDTGSFRHENTTPDSLRATARLIERGADYQRVMRAVFQNETPSMLRLKGMVFERLKMALDGRLAYFFLTSEMMESCGVDSKDTEDLIDIVRSLRGVDVVCRIQEVSDGVRFSFRSQNPDYPIIGLAQRFGGGGHAMAAGASGDGMTLQEAETLLVQYTEDLLSG